MGKSKAKLICVAVTSICVLQHPFCHGQIAIPSSGVISTIAGNGLIGFSGDGSSATLAAFRDPERLAVDLSGNVYIADYGNNRVRKVSAATGVITTVAGTGVAGYSGDGGSPTQAELSSPVGVAVDASGNIFISDYGTNRIREISASTGSISTIAGTGTAGYTGDGGAAKSAELSGPTGLAVDLLGNVYIADYGNHRIRKVTVATGIISTVAGNGISGSTGDGQLAVNAELTSVFAVAVDGTGNLYIPDHGNSRIRKVTVSTGIITTVVGNGTAAYSGDGGLATSAAINSPSGLSIDAVGNIFFADTNNDRIRKVTAVTGIITTVAGTGTPSFTGDKGAATSATLSYPEDVAIDAAGNLYIMDYTNYRVRAIGAVKTAAVVNLSISSASGTYGATPPTVTATVPSGTALVTFTSSAGWTSDPITVTNGKATATVSTAGLKVGTYTVTAAYSGNNAYYAATGKTTFAVTQASSSLTWPTPAPINYGTPLSAAQLNAAIGVQGTIVYTPAIGTILPAGTSTLTAKFTPADSVDYAVVSASVSIIVNKATPTIVWPTPSAIRSGTALSVSQLDATSPVPGTFSYNPGTGTILAAGNHTLSVSFSPSTPANYLTGSASVTIAVVTTQTLTISPTVGVPGSTVTITNQGYGATQGTSTVTFNGTAVTVSGWTSSSITAIVPQTLIAGNYNVAVNLSGIAAGQQTFTVIPQITSISYSLSPTIYTALSGPPLAGFIITGTGFGPNNTPPNSNVTLGGTPLTISNWVNDNQIYVQIPAGFPKGGPPGQVVVSYSGFMSKDSIMFSVVCPFACPQGVNCQ